MKEFLQKIKKNITFEKVIVRLVMAWLLTTLVFFVKNSGSFETPAYAANINMPMYLCFVLLFFAFFCALGQYKLFAWVETYGPMILVTVYGFLTVSSINDVTYLVGLLLVLAIAVGYAVSKTKVFIDIKKKSTVYIIYGLAACFYLTIAGGTVVLRYLNYASPAFDFGIWVQMFHNMRTTLEPVTTVERERVLSHFAVHFSPIYYLFLPFYAIFPSPITLQVLQVVTLASGLIPVCLLCKKFGLSKTATAAFGIIFALFPVLTTGCFYDLHENCFLVPILLWLFYFIEKDKLKGIVIFSLLLLMVKEDAPLYLACVGLYMIFGKRKYACGTIVTAAAIGFFGIVMFIMQRFGLGVMTYRYDNFIAEEGGGLMDVVRNFVTNPAYALSQCFTGQKLEFLLYMFLPLGFMPLVTDKISKFILLLPMLVVNLATDYKYQYSIFFQYAFGTLAILFYLAISNYAELSEKARRFMCSIAICGSIVILPVCSLSKSYYIDSYRNSAETRRILDDVVASIPKDASVSASTFLVPHLAQRTEVYEYPRLYGTKIETDYVIYDARYGELKEADRKELEDLGYVSVSEAEGVYELFMLDDDGIKSE